MCVDFAKAFDSVEHEMIRNVMEFFGYGQVMVGMVMTLLNDRKSPLKVVIVRVYKLREELPKGIDRHRIYL